MIVACENLGTPVDLLQGSEFPEEVLRYIIEKS
jgi:hypothetical protein